MLSTHGRPLPPKAAALCAALPGEFSLVGHSPKAPELGSGRSGPEPRSVHARGDAPLSRLPLPGGHCFSLLTHWTRVVFLGGRGGTSQGQGGRWDEGERQGLVPGVGAVSTLRAGDRASGAPAGSWQPSAQPGWCWPAAAGVSFLLCSATVILAAAPHPLYGKTLLLSVNRSLRLKPPQQPGAQGLLRQRARVYKVL